ncbi:MAG: hypothetical protein WBO10_02135 [Pyrinomonadaceae bacterium]
MTPRFYGMLWIGLAILAGVMFVSGAFNLLTLAIFGFILFGLVFVGMICVLPGTVSHPPKTNADIGVSAPRKSMPVGERVGSSVGLTGQPSH